MKIDIGIAEPARKAIAEQLGRLLADTYLLYLKTQNFHWNVEGPQFHSLHALFEGQYEALAEATDEIAERIRALGLPAPGSFAQFSRLASIKEETKALNSDAMITQLLQDHEQVIRTARAVFPLAEQATDTSTSDLVNDRIAYHQKAAWMLRSLLA